MGLAAPGKLEDHKYDTASAMSSMSFCDDAIIVKYDSSLNLITSYLSINELN